MNNISNFYENLVFEKITELNNNRKLILSYDAIQDIACLALNQLPPRYIRHAIDTMFFIPDDERGQINDNIEKAVCDAIEKVADKPSRSPAAS